MSSNNKSMLINKNIPLLIQMVGVVIVILNVWLAVKLAPIAQDVSVMQTKVNALEKEEEKHVNHDEFTQVVTRLDKISGRVDEVINILMKR
jgi:hypothetical protein